jgi:hypothetical protein
MTDEDRPDQRAGGADGAEGTGAGTSDEEVWAALVASFHASPDERRDGLTVSAEPVGTGEGDDVGDPAGDPIPAEPTAVPATPRTWSPEESAEEHFVPPLVGPAPPLEPMTKAAWLATLGGPLALVVMVLTGWEAPGWAVWACSLAFVAGFVTLVVRMRSGDDPGGDDGAVV